MNNISQLLIRACKSKNPTRRLKSVYRRFYGRYDERTEDVAISDILVHLVDKVAPMKLSEYLREVSSYRSYHEVKVMCRKKNQPVPVEDPSYITTGYVMKDRLRRIGVAGLIDLGVRTPAMFRSKV